MIGGLADPLGVDVSHSDAHVGVQIQMPHVGVQIQMPHVGVHSDAHMPRELEEIVATHFFFSSFVGLF